MKKEIDWKEGLELLGSNYFEYRIKNKHHVFPNKNLLQLKANLAVGEINIL